MFATTVAASTMQMANLFEAFFTTAGWTRAWFVDLQEHYRGHMPVASWLRVPTRPRHVFHSPSASP